SPPFYSHAKPLAVLGHALFELGEQVSFACIPAFAGLAGNHELDFYEFEGSTNRNLGDAGPTEQSYDDGQRLRSFFSATHLGAIPALRVQAMNRERDMLKDPLAIIRSVIALRNDLRPDWFLVDQLSYPVTLALYCLGERFASFCASHPS